MRWRIIWKASPRACATASIRCHWRGNSLAAALGGALVVCGAAAYVSLQDEQRDYRMKAAFLPDRGVVKVLGEDARNFLGGLVTTDVERIGPGSGRFGALLTPQGKIVVDFLITEAPSGDGGFLLDCPRALAQTLADKLRFYKLRAKVTVENLSDGLGVIAVWDGEAGALPDLAFADPRQPSLGLRILAPKQLAPKIAELIGAELVDASAYEAHRIACGVPRGGLDFIYGDAFPHETNMDSLHGVDFDKGCYVGQEVVSRMQHRGTARTRIVRIALDGPSPEAGTTILAGDKAVGTMGSTAGERGLALVRVDRVADALEAGHALTAGGLSLRLADPDALKSAAKPSVA
ncbi:MAG: folate-binding protein YgfZ [Bradyrhizobium sp.]|nr:folate-binding protein [Bradyrhizobium sp.]MBV9980814.1 folate-binding protein YgfZ [Bradyrhizobium sp.]